MNVPGSKDLFLTEAQIRKVLTRMGDHGFVHLSNGRGGTTITPAGIEALKRLRTSNRLSWPRIWIRSLQSACAPH